MFRKVFFFFGFYLCFIFFSFWKIVSDLYWIPVSSLTPSIGFMIISSAVNNHRFQSIFTKLSFIIFRALLCLKCDSQILLIFSTNWTFSSLGNVKISHCYPLQIHLSSSENPKKKLKCLMLAIQQNEEGSVLVIVLTQSVKISVSRSGTMWI